MNSIATQHAQPPTTLPMDYSGEDQQARADGYRLLGALLAAAPSAELLALLTALETDENATEVGQQPIEPLWAALRQAALQADPASLEQDYWRLFIGLGRGELLPYLSWYQTGYLMEEPLAVLRDRLQQLGFQRQPGVGEPEDHATALCEVMATLITDGSDFNQQQQFFEQFIGPWLGRFFDDLGNAEPAGFYTHVGRLGAAFISIEQRYFSMSV